MFGRLGIVFPSRKILVSSRVSWHNLLSIDCFQKILCLLLILLLLLIFSFLLKLLLLRKYILLQIFLLRTIFASASENDENSPWFWQFKNYILIHLKKVFNFYRNLYSHRNALRRFVVCLRYTFDHDVRKVAQPIGYGGWHDVDVEFDTENAGKFVNSVHAALVNIRLCVTMVVFAPSPWIQKLSKEPIDSGFVTKPCYPLWCEKCAEGKFQEM